MSKLKLTRHPSTPCEVVQSIEVEAERLRSELRLCYSIQGEIRHLAYPYPAQPRRCDDLWKHTCCECFIKACGETQYHEFNFAPSTSWALYRFSAYREERTEPPYPGAPKIVIRLSPEVFELEARFALKPLAMLDTPIDLALSAVLETDDGSLSYWAVRHPSAEPDFHHPEGFALTLEPVTTGS